MGLHVGILSVVRCLRARGAHSEHKIPKPYRRGGGVMVGVSIHHSALLSKYVRILPGAMTSAMPVLFDELVLSTSRSQTHVNRHADRPTSCSALGVLRGPGI